MSNIHVCVWNPYRSNARIYLPLGTHIAFVRKSAKMNIKYMWNYISAHRQRHSVKCLGIFFLCFERYPPGVGGTRVIRNFIGKCTRAVYYIADTRASYKKPHNVFCGGSMARGGHNEENHNVLTINFRSKKFMYSNKVNFSNGNKFKRPIGFLFGVRVHLII